MLRAFCISTLIAFASFAVYAEEQNPDAACASSAECVVVEQGGCNGSWLTVNKIHEEQYIKRATDINSVIECEKAPVFPPKPEATCVNHFCTLVEK